MKHICYLSFRWFYIADGLFTKALQVTPPVFDDNLNDSPVLFYVADFSLLSCKSDNFTFMLLYGVIFILISN